MPYTDLDTIVKTIPREIVIQLTDDNRHGVVDTSVVDLAISDAQSRIDSHTRGRYPADLDTADVPPFLKTIATCMAIYWLYCRKLILTIPEPLEKKYAQCIKELVNVKNGDQTPFPLDKEPEVVIVKTRARVFTTDLLDKYTC